MVRWTVLQAANQKGNQLCLLVCCQSGVAHLDVQYSEILQITHYNTSKILMYSIVKFCKLRITILIKS
jgi:hypothetical protein